MIYFQTTKVIQQQEMPFLAIWVKERDKDIDVDVDDDWGMIAQIHGTGSDLIALKNLLSRAWCLRCTKRYLRMSAFIKYIK